jgi:hypothetical protein
VCILYTTAQKSDKTVSEKIRLRSSSVGERIRMEQINDLGTRSSDIAIKYIIYRTQDGPNDKYV